MAGQRTLPRNVWSVIRVFLFDTANGGVKRLTKRMTSRRNGPWLPRLLPAKHTSSLRVYERPRQVSYGCECTAHQCRPDQRRKPGQIETRPTANVLPRDLREPPRVLLLLVLASLSDNVVLDLSRDSCDPDVSVLIFPLVRYELFNAEATCKSITGSN